MEIVIVSRYGVSCSPDEEDWMDRCGWCDSTHVADAHACTCAQDCGVGWCCAAEDLRVGTRL
jgi:hypothetical protein